MKTAIIVLLAAVLCLASGARADVPHYINYQGQLSDSAGTPITGSVILNFAIYESETSTGWLWSEVQSVSVSNGLFDVRLGDVQPLTADVFASGGVVWLEVRETSSTVSPPRVPIVSVPYTYRAEIADTAIVAVSLEPNSVDSSKIENRTIALEDIAQNGAAEGQVMKWLGGMWLAANDSVGDGGGSGDITGVWTSDGLTGGGGEGDVEVGIAPGGVTESKLASGSVTPPKIAPFSVSSSHIGDNQILLQHLADNSVGSNEIVDLSVTSADLAWNSVNALRIAADAVHSEELAVDAVESENIADNAITRDHIQTDAVGASEIEFNAVGTSEIANQAVGYNQLALGAVNGDIILDGTVGGADLASPSVSRTKIYNDAVNAAKISDEPGIVNILEGGDITFVDDFLTPVISGSISIPAAGYVVAECQFSVSIAYAWLMVAVDTGFSADPDIHTPYGIERNPSVSESRTLTFSDIVYLNGAGTYYFQANGRAQLFDPSSSSRVFYRQMRLTYYPTAYGTVTKAVTAAEASQFESSEIATDARMNPDGSVSERTVHVVDLRDLELRATRARLEAERLERELLEAQQER